MTKKHMRTTLREVAFRTRIEGFGDAVRDLGTHKICGIDVPYSQKAVRDVLAGKYFSRRIMARIVANRPDLLGLSLVAESTKEHARAMGWKEAVA